MAKILLTLPDGQTMAFDKNKTECVYLAVASFLNPDVAAVTQKQHMIAANAEGWSELASIGECYEDREIPGLKIEITE